MPEAMNEAVELPVGPELDAAVARALGWTQDEGFWVQPKGWRASFPLQGHAPRFSTDWGPAGEIVECLRRRGWEVDLHAFPPGPNLPEGWRFQMSKGDIFHQDIGDSMPEAVCRVVLLAANVLEEQVNA